VTTGFQVDLPAVDRLISTLEEGAQRVREANAELGGYAGVEELDDAGGFGGRFRGMPERMEVLGNSSLAEAAQRFATKWRYGLDKLDEAAEAVLDRLHDTRRTYHAVDDACRRLFEGLAAPLGDSATGAPGASTGGIAGVLDGQS
jgi:hypothetical protein